MSKSGTGKNNSKSVFSVIKPILNIIVLILVVALIALVSIKAYHLGYEITSYKPSADKEAPDVEITITPDMSVKDVGYLLIRKGLLDESLMAFLVQERLSVYHDEFIPGTYVLNPTMTVEEMLRTISTTEEES